MEELARTFVHRSTYRGADIVLWWGMYRVTEPTGQQIEAGGLSATVNNLDVPIELDGDEGAGELLAKVRRWIDRQG